MAVINDSTIAANIARVGMGSGMTFIPQHVASGPITYGDGGAYGVSLESGVISAAINQNSELFQFRYVTSNSRVCLVNGVSISAGANVAATGAVNCGLEMVVARSWTAAGSGGTRATLTGNNAKLRTSGATSEVNDIGVCSTAALTVGTKTLDAQAINAVEFGVITGAITVAPTFNLIPQTVLFGSLTQPIAYPLVLANQEGFVIRTGARQFPATMTWSLQVSVFWMEVNGF